MKKEPVIPAGDPGPYTFVIRGTDTDCEDRLHLFALLSYMQESAYFNAGTGGLGTGELDSLGLCWMLIRLSVRLRELPRWGGIVTVKTWSRGCRRLTWVRDYEFFDQDGVLFGAASSEWLIADARSHRPQKPDILPTASRHAVSAEAALPDDVRRPSRLEIHPDDSPVLVQYADFSDIDRNRHVNNTRYAAWCMNAVHAFAGERVSGLQSKDLDIHFISEVRRGDKLHCFCGFSADDGPGGGLYRVEARRDDNEATVVFRAEVRMA